MKFSLSETHLLKLSLGDAIEGAGQESTLRHRVTVNEGNPLVFAVVYHLQNKVGENFWLNLQYAVSFLAEENLPDDFKESNIAKINAPAVAFPYLRAFVAQFCALSGFEKLTLPVKRFVA